MFEKLVFTKKGALTEKGDLRRGFGDESVPL